jgi:sugar phosphate isomerase/epimerase
VIAAQLYTVRDRLQKPEQVGGVLGRLREIGYTAVEVAGLGPRSVESFGEELRRAGLGACAAHESLEHLKADLPAVAGRCRAWGCRYVVVPSLPPRYHSAAGFRRFAHEAVEIARQLVTFDLRLAYHNHSYELERWDGKSGLEILFESAPEGALSAELDTFWLQVAGASPATWVRRLSGRVPLVHLKDMTVVSGRVVQAEVGDGNLDWAEILDACQQAGTEWLVVEQDETVRDPLDSLAVSYRNLSRLWHQIPHLYDDFAAPRA